MDTELEKNMSNVKVLEKVDVNEIAYMILEKRLLEVINTYADRFEAKWGKGEFNLVAKAKGKVVFNLSFYENNARDLALKYVNPSHISDYKKVHELVRDIRKSNNKNAKFHNENGVYNGWEEKSYIFGSELTLVKNPNAHLLRGNHIQ